MADQVTGNVQVDTSKASEELTLLQQAAELLEAGRDAGSYEEGTSMAVMSMAHTALHVAQTQSAREVDPIALRLAVTKWEQLGRVASGEWGTAADAFNRCAREVRVLLGDLR